MIESYLKRRIFVKLVCGAGTEDAEYVKRLVYIYALGGCHVFDISARRDILDAAKEGARLAEVENPVFCVSVGIKGDPHISKARVKSGQCILCGNCKRNCVSGAVCSAGIIDDKKCVGCGACARKCPTGAIEMYEKDVNVKSVLPELVKEGAEILELHVTGHDKKDLDYKWQIINECHPKFASICIDRQNFSNKEVIERIKEMISIRKPYTTIIQADGIPMSGCDDKYKTTLQAVAMAEIIQNANLPVYTVVSGGTNTKTAELCDLCGINANGIAVGSWARWMAKYYLDAPDFWENKQMQHDVGYWASEFVSKFRFRTSC